MSSVDSSKTRWRALIIAVREGNLPKVSSLLQENPKLALTPGPHSLLHHAVYAASDCARILQELLQAGVPPDTTNSASVCALHLAARKGCLSCIRELLDNDAQLEVLDSEQQTPLHFAVSSNFGGSDACIQLLLERGSSVDASCEKGLTPLHLAAQLGNVVAVRLLLEKDAYLEARDKDGCTPLHLATTRGVVEALLAAGAELTSQDDKQQTPLERAIEFHPTVAQTLLDAGVEVRGNPQENDLRVFFNLNAVTGGSNPCEVDLLEKIAKSRHNDQLKHPLCEMFLHLKWYHVRPLFYLNSLIRMTMVIAFSIFLTLHPNFTCTGYERNCTNVTDYGDNLAISATGVLTAILLLLVILIGVLQILAIGITYLRRVSVWITFLFAATSIPLIVTDCQLGIPGLHLGVIALMTGWVQVTLLLSLTPSVGIYMQMFISVTKKMFKFILVFLPLFVGCAAAFNLNFQCQYFGSTVPAILKSLAMMVGDVAFGDVFLSGEDSSGSPTKEILYVSYLLLMTITATNLLVGLAIEDIQVLMEKASVNRLALTVMVEMYTEEFLHSPFFQKFLSRIVPGRLTDMTSFLSNLAPKTLTLSRQHSAHKGPIHFHPRDFKVGGRRKADKYFNVFVCPNRSKEAGTVFRNLRPSEYSGDGYDERPAGYTLPIWIVRNIKELIDSDRFKKKEAEVARWRQPRTEAMDL